MAASAQRKAAQSLMVLLVSVAGVVAAEAATIDVEVLGPDGEPVAGVAVFLDGKEAGDGSQDQATAVMDQIDTRFVPHMLVVRKGTAVEFPNSDIVAHHVYSFSKPNDFVLPLYKGDAHAPVTFDHDGVVTLGCNIHDDMLGYIVVVDSGAFGVTDASGVATLNLQRVADQLVTIWSPRIRDDEAALQQSIGNGARVTFRLQKKLRPPHHSESEAVQWSEY
jgi:plastocyanin